MVATASKHKHVKVIILETDIPYARVIDPLLEEKGLWFLLVWAWRSFQDTKTVAVVKGSNAFTFQI
jgi:hypothetical protein